MFLVPNNDALLDSPWRQPNIRPFCTLCPLVPVNVVLETSGIKYLGEVVVTGKPETRAR